jgi:hypothetical protein
MAHKFFPPPPLPNQLLQENCIDRGKKLLPFRNLSRIDMPQFRIDSLALQEKKTLGFRTFKVRVEEYEGDA